MNRKILQQLVQASYNDNSLQADVVNMIVDKLSRRELKQYLKGLKAAESKKEIIVTSAVGITEKTKQIFSHLFPEKEIIYNTNRDLVAGMQVLDNDIEYDMSMGTKIDNIAQYLEN